MKNSKMKWLLLIGVLSVLLVAVIAFSKRRNVYYLQAKKGDVLEAIYGLGKVETDEVFELKIGVMGNVKSLFVNEGDFVKKGQRMINFENIGAFFAPFSGTITSAEYKDGELVSPQVPVLRLENLDKKYIQVSLEQEAALRVRPGQQAKIVFQSLSGGTILGRVERVYPKNGEFIARINVDTIDSHVLPGMTADVVIEVGSKKDVVLIPIKAISSGQVIRRRNGKKEKIDVVTGHTDGLWSELVEGDILLTDELLVKGKK